jgi:hypothetical protein
MAKTMKISNVSKTSINNAIDSAIFKLFEAKNDLNRNKFEKTD